MKKYQVALTKSYLVTVRAKTKEGAMHIAEFYTGDSQDISIDQDRKRYNFAIEQIECTVNESWEVI
ncbi:MAG: hypothetical protein A3J10_01220 [Candidatus Sungbacteria bacterium RIFCSPLOWO2_02_FULL_54_10]|uniref:Uncharacterized protein n=2 Tax=Candidatus Sungiibacteriota TaxID=1817917 RepID=A0A1G2L974_9BACT|nr:MAG: hypothetical protein A2679_00730 [Candidatus Sungbacteria bacterium RIFCSPHIGHO2_01_FULL_54_26]OHA04201.1 MAG: hypothetical protein A3C92_00400 [Candidatus Sungbacteria bacterium RIFCSPHIGHO2_02_FULL_53_17]OHA08080.1 MAG: hypothetical protein A3B34_01755 [Candidatus Sungbacteria bacterium RIFCSPLOWO2_01_FULL_54_21]OHA13742.1 MAG: hypothetical protein A3J10_01220 [Candidatus Sungbacteria bacterium RIFCSPLOWO2_02_FULL_54_10]